jgi:hypothetical protein
MIKKEFEVGGRKFLIGLPEGVNDVNLGINFGPPDIMDELEIPEPIATRLHNQLFNRGLLTLLDIQRKPAEVQAALQSALKLDAARIVTAYANAEKENLPFD